MKIWRKTTDTSCQAFTIHKLTYVNNQTVDTPYTERWEELYDTAIGEGNKRRWQLMNEDNLVLRFSSERNIVFKIGDFVWYDDRRFILTKPYTPSDDAESGGYDYEIPFEADYRYAQNRMFKLSGKEITWSLTALMERHLEHLMEMLKAENITFRYIENDTYYEKYFTFDIQNYTPEDGENIRNSSKAITYTSTSMLDAITKIAEIWKCEWWFRDEVLWYGKCEEGEFVDFHRDYLNGVKPNIESIDGGREKEGYATRLYIYGSKDNLPARYDRVLKFDPYNPQTSAGRKIFKDTTRLLNPDMFQGSASTTIHHPSTYQYHFAWDGESIVLTGLSGETATINLDLAVDCSTLAVQDKFYMTAKVYCADGNDDFTLTSEEVAYDASGNYQFTFESSGKLLLTYLLYIDIELFGITGGKTKSVNMTSLTCSGDVDVTLRRIWVDTKIDFGSGLKNCIINPNHVDESNPDFSLISVAEGDYENAQYQLTDIVHMNVPIEYYTTDNPLGYSERRLHMDSSDEDGTDYIKRGVYVQEKGISDDEIVEGTLVLDEIKPNAIFKIVNVNTWTKEEKTDQGTITHIYYDLSITQRDGSPFEFSTKAILEGSKLRARFMTNPSDSTKGLLNGMDFDMGFYPHGKNGRRDYQEFEIVNGTSGEQEIPNSVLRPQVGDELVLYGWDVQAVAMDSLVASAQNQLKEKAVEYLRKSKIDANTYTCPMFSDIPNQFVMGRRVKLYSSLFENGYRESRITGAEFNLDLPWDTPVYTISKEVNYSSVSTNEKIDGVTSIAEEPEVLLPPAGNENRPIYIDSNRQPQEINGLDVPNNIHSEKNIEAKGGVSANGLNDLSLGGGGGGSGDVNSVQFDPNVEYQEGQPYTPQTGSGGKIKLPAYPTEPTPQEKAAWNAKYNKPSGGIPKSDLSESVQESLEKADSAVQPENLTPITNAIGQNAARIDDLNDKVQEHEERITEHGEQIDTHIADTDNPHQVTKGQVGLGNVDNTSDADKPVSTAQQAALDLKVDKNSLKSKGDHDTPIYFDSNGAPQEIDALNVEGNIESTQGGVSAQGLADLSLSGGGGSGDVNSVEFDPNVQYEEGQPYTPQTGSGGKIKLPAYPTEPNVVTYGNLNPSEAESTSKVPTAKSVAILKDQLDVESFEEYDPTKDYKRGEHCKVTVNGVPTGYRFKLSTSAGTAMAGRVDKVSSKTLATPLCINDTELELMLD